MRPLIRLKPTKSPIYWLNLSDNPDADEADEPEVMINALHHAREPIGVVATRLFHVLFCFENYTKDAEIKYLVNHTEFYIVPCINADGYIYNYLTNPKVVVFGEKMPATMMAMVNLTALATALPQSKLRHVLGLRRCRLLARSGQRYLPRTGPFSEPETQAMKYFCEQHEFLIALNYHAFSNLLIYPWGHIPDYETPDSILFRAYAKLLTEQNHYRYGTGNQTVNYLNNGNSDDWMYGEQTTKNKIFSFTPEVGGQEDGFWPKTAFCHCATKMCGLICTSCASPTLTQSWRCNPICTSAN